MLTPPQELSIVTGTPGIEGALVEEALPALARCLVRPGVLSHQGNEGRRDAAQQRAEGVVQLQRTRASEALAITDAAEPLVGHRCALAHPLRGRRVREVHPELPVHGGVRDGEAFAQQEGLQGKNGLHSCEMPLPGLVEQLVGRRESLAGRRRQIARQPWN